MQLMEKTLQLQTPNQEGRETVSPPSTQNRDNNENQDFCMPTVPVQVEESSCVDSSGVPAHVAPSPLTHYAPHPENSSSNMLDGLDLDGHGPRQEDDAVSTVNVTRLPEPLLQTLIDIFYRSIYPIFPIIHRRDFQPQYEHWLSLRRIGDSNDDAGDGFSFLVYALLAVAASVIPEEHAVFHQPGLQFYRWINLGDLLYSHANTRCSGWPSQWNAMSAVNFVIAQGLLSLYLIEGGKVNDAWVTAGHAIRLYQSSDIEDFTNTAADEGDTPSARHRNIWRCLYILDRSLSTALLKPMAIDDVEGDMDSCDKVYQPSTLEDKTESWFSIIADFHVTMGRIYRTLRWIRKPQLSQRAKFQETLRSYIRKYDTELEEYFTKRVLPKVEEPSRQVQPLALQTIAVSSYYTGVVLLYRTFIEQFNIAEPEAFLRCAEAASNCIKVTPQVIATVPASHFVIQQSRAIYVSTKVLLHCMRLARNAHFTNNAWPDVESGCNMLRRFNIQWPEIKKYQLLTQEDMLLTQVDLNKHEVFHRTFDRYGQVSHRRPLEYGESLQTTRPSQRECRREHAATKGPKPGLAGTPESLMSSKHGQDCRLWERQSKKRKLSQNPFPPISVPSSSSSSSFALNTMPVSREPGSCPMVDQTMGTSDFPLPDISPLLSAPEDSSTNFFGNALFTTSLDPFFLQSDG